MNRLHAVEAAIVTTLTRMGPLTFGHIVQMVRDERQLVGYGLNRLRAQGKVMIHEHRAIENASGASKTIPVYCAHRPPSSAGSGALAADIAEVPDQPEGNHDLNAACPACGWKRFGTGATE